MLIHSHLIYLFVYMLTETLHSSEYITLNGMISERRQKGELQPPTGDEGPERVYRYSSTLSSTSAPDRGGWTTPRHSRFSHGKES
jgi:hypothetical protein